MAFVLTNVEQTILDFGDAPVPTYPTLLINNGARHGIGPLFMGNLIDGELNGQPNANATGDDINNTDDEDGVIFTSALKPGQNATIVVTASQGGGYLNAWADFNGDGDWNENNEQIFTNTLLAAGINNLAFNIPANAALGKTYLRFRLSTVVNLSYVGAAPDGEVEDYINWIVEPGTSKMHWPQLPDFNPNGAGVDVDLSWTSAADDFLCTSTGSINHIVIWSSFANDMLPSNGPGGDTIQLLIHTDIPEEGEIQFSRPGPVVWSKIFVPGTYTASQINTNTPQWWYDPATQIWQANNNDSTYRFDFYLSTIDTPYVQTQGSIYWLEVRYLHSPFFVDGSLGWKSTQPSLRWNDAAVWFNPNNYNFPIGWAPLSYPTGHPLQNQPMGLSFVIFHAPDPSDIHGHVNYDNQDLTPMDTTPVMLYSGGTLLSTFLTNQEGFYHFTELPPGTYNLSGTSSKPWGGANSADAMIIMQHFVHYLTLTGIRAKAADVTASNGINSLDALTVARRFVGFISSFPAGDWVFETPSVVIPYPGTYIKDFKAICYGDVNGSNENFGKIESAVSLESDSYINWDGYSDIVIPIRIKESCKSSAISLILAYPDYVHFNKVNFNYPNKGNFMFNIVDNELRISWYSLSHCTFTAGDTLLSLSLSLTKCPDAGLFSLSEYSEFADLEGNIIPDVVLLQSKVIKSSSPYILLHQNNPNPFMGNTQIVFSLYEPANITMDIRTLHGNLVMKVLEDKAVEPGVHTIDLSVQDLPQGIYSCTLRAYTLTSIYKETIKMVVMK